MYSELQCPSLCPDAKMAVIYIFTCRWMSELLFFPHHARWTALLPISPCSRPPFPRDSPGSQQLQFCTSDCNAPRHPIVRRDLSPWHVCRKAAQLPTAACSRPQAAPCLYGSQLGAGIDRLGMLVLPSYRSHCLVIALGLEGFQRRGLSFQGRASASAALALKKVRASLPLSAILSALCS